MGAACSSKSRTQRLEPQLTSLRQAPGSRSSGAICVGDAPLDAEHIRAHLGELHSAGRAFHYAVVLPLRVVGAAICVVSFVVVLHLANFSVHNVFATQLVGPTINQLGLTIVLLSLTPAQPRMVRGAVFLSLGLGVTFALVYAAEVAYIGAIAQPRHGTCVDLMLEARVPCRCSVLLAELFAFCGLVVACATWVLAPSARAEMPARLRLERLLHVIGVTFLLLGVHAELWFGASLLLHPALPLIWDVTHQVNALQLIGVGAMLYDPRVPAYAQAWLASRSEAVRTAAGIGSLLSASTPDVVAAKAARLFRCVSLARVSYEHLSSNEPDPALHALTRPTALGAADAFISHSWHDSPHRKWTQLQAWRRRFVREHGREPLVWLDRFSINQSSIAESLECLPVWVAACQECVAICGDTYLSRLWCLVELYVYVEMGGSAASMTLMMAQRGDDGAALPLDAALPGVDVRRAECAHEEDQRHLRAIIEGSFGGADHFNSALRAILGECKRVDPAHEAEHTLHDYVGQLMHVKLGHHDEGQAALGHDAPSERMASAHHIGLPRSDSVSERDGVMTSGSGGRAADAGRHGDSGVAAAASRSAGGPSVPQRPPRGPGGRAGARSPQTML